MALSQHKPKLTKTALALRKRRDELMGKARQGDLKASAELMREYGIRVYTASEVQQAIKERPELIDPKLKGNTFFDQRKANN